MNTIKATIPDHQFPVEVEVDGSVVANLNPGENSYEFEAESTSSIEFFELRPGWIREGGEQIPLAPPSPPTAETVILELL